MNNERKNNIVEMPRRNKKKNEGQRMNSEKKIILRWNEYRKKEEKKNEKNASVPQGSCYGLKYSFVVINLLFSTTTYSAVWKTGKKNNSNQAINSMRGNEERMKERNERKFVSPVAWIML